MEDTARRARRASNGRPPIIGLDDILASASALSERIGVDRLTMAMVAKDLSVTTTALYHYVPNRQALIDLVVDMAFDRIEAPPASAGSWDQRIRLFERAVREQLRRLPGSGSALMNGTESRPSSDRLIEVVIEILTESGAPAHEVQLAFTTLYAYMIGQLALDGISQSEHQVDLEDLQRPTDPDKVTADELFEYGIETVLVGLKQRLNPATD
jgi:AcrR family transcriptional regulator